MLKEETASRSNEKETELHLLQNLKEEYEGAFQRDCEATAA